MNSSSEVENRLAETLGDKKVCTLVASTQYWWGFGFSELFLIRGSRINFVKIRACFNFHKCVPVLAFFVHWEGERKSNDGKSDNNFWLFFPLIVAENSSQTLYSIDCQCINRRKSSRVVRHFKFSAYYVMITYLYDALSFLKHFLTFQLLNIIVTVVLVSISVSEMPSN